MQVRELIEALKRAPGDALVVIGGDVIHGVHLVHGDLSIGYYNPQFTFNPRGKSTAVMFTANTELSTGEVVSGRK